MTDLKGQEEALGRLISSRARSSRYHIGRAPPGINARAGLERVFRLLTWCRDM